MPRTGRPPKPIEQHKRNGTYRADRHSAALMVVPATEPALVELDPLSVFERVLADGGNWLAQTDTMALTMLREALEERRGIRERVMAGSGERRELRDLDKQIIAQLSALGFDPTARSRLGVAEVTRVSKLANLQAKSKS